MKDGRRKRAVLIICLCFSLTVICNVDAMLHRTMSLITMPPKNFAVNCTSIILTIDKILTTIPWLKIT